MKRILSFSAALVLSSTLFVFGSRAAVKAAEYRQQTFMVCSPWSIAEVLFPLLLFGALLFLYESAVSLFRKKNLVTAVLLAVSLLLAFLYLLLLWIPSGSFGGMIWDSVRRASPVMACYSAWLIYALVRRHKET